MTKEKDAGFGHPPRRRPWRWPIFAARRPPDCGTSVKRVALANGFTELGRFSGLYRQIYDELPSATLARALAW